MLIWVELIKFRDRRLRGDLINLIIYGNDYKISVYRSPSVLAKLAKYEKSASSTNGVLTEELVGNGVELNGEESEEEEQERIKIKSPLTAMQEIMQQKQLEEVRNKWKSNDQGDSIEARTQEQMAEERKSEMARFRWVLF